MRGLDLLLDLLLLPATALAIFRVLYFPSYIIIISSFASYCTLTPLQSDALPQLTEEDLKGGIFVPEAHIVCSLLWIISFLFFL